MVASTAEHAPWRSAERDDACLREHQRVYQVQRAQASQLASQERRYAPVRLVLFIVGLALVLHALSQILASLAWVAVALLAMVPFVVSVRVHTKLRQRLGRARHKQAVLASALARLGAPPEDGSPLPSVQGQATQASLFAEDLDLFGPSSLFASLCRAQTSAGQDTLARWFTEDVDRAEILARQGAVQELEPELDGRIEFSARTYSVPSWSYKALLGYFNQHGPDPGTLVRRSWTFAVLGIFNLALGLGAVFATGLDPNLRLAMLVALPVIAGVAGRWVATRCPARDAAISQSLKGFNSIEAGLVWIEGRVFHSPFLVQQRSKIVSGTNGRVASRSLVAFRRTHDLYQVGRAEIFAIFGFLLLWTQFFAVRLELERQRLAPGLAEYLRALGVFEAVSSLAGHAYEQPQDAYPQVLAPNEPPTLELTRVRHPLLDRRVAVPNPVRLGVDVPGSPQIIVLSGSNMSGKSTYLRSIGLALILMRLGTRVPAAQMRSSNWRLGTHLRSQDDLAKGLSRFGAEVAKMADIVRSARQRDETPFLFLLDEILSGTNSHDRRIAVEALVRTLLDLGCAGWITTHDLALTEIATELEPRTTNHHFEDQFTEHELSFDYTLREGVVSKSNALALMRHAGLLTTSQ